MSVHILVTDEPDVEDLFCGQCWRDLRAGRLQIDLARSTPLARERDAEVRGPSLNLILSNLNMPGTSGLEKLSQVRGKWLGVLGVMIKDANTRRKVFESGAVGLTKPTDFGQLRQEIDLRLVQAP
ncbi:response regulator [Bradyrhizobium jicamae]|uniref:response regulator n=1 Tax=Bradyrhizobium jicamae TaxID=280332 RepID=UPI001BA6264B|nr:response regulator [Bradyrhizobium jicamae]MBR0939535.1 response regulator [Bradyrhizobium jicamae]